MFQSSGFAELVAATMHLSRTGVFEGSQYKGSASKLMWPLCVLFLAGSYFQHSAGGWSISGSVILLQTAHTPSRLFYYCRKWRRLWLCDKHGITKVLHAWGDLTEKQASVMPFLLPPSWNWSFLSPWLGEADYGGSLLSALRAATGYSICPLKQWHSI